LCIFYFIPQEKKYGHHPVLQVRVFTVSVAVGLSAVQRVERLSQRCTQYC
jgi:hypothetical protein